MLTQKYWQATWQHCKILNLSPNDRRISYCAKVVSIRIRKSEKDNENMRERERDKKKRNIDNEFE